jgi:hypothetical protein
MAVSGDEWDGAMRDRSDPAEGEARRASVSEAALILQVPEAEGLVGPFRLAYDPSAAVGVPAHITINYPFLPALNFDADQEGTLKALFGRLPPLHYWLRQARRFPDVLYLVPDPVQLFVDLIRLVAERFPESPPYGGAYQEIIPHLTVAQPANPGDLDSIEADFMQRAQAVLPIECHADRIWLFNRFGDLWVSRRSFLLGGGEG